MKDTTHPETNTEYSHHAADQEVTLRITNIHYVSMIFFFCRPVNSKNFRLYKPHTVSTALLGFVFLNSLKIKNHTSPVDFTKK